MQERKHALRNGPLELRGHKNGAHCLRICPPSDHSIELEFVDESLNWADVPGPGGRQEIARGLSADL